MASDQFAKKEEAKAVAHPGQWCKMGCCGGLDHEGASSTMQHAVAAGGITSISATVTSRRHAAASCPNLVGKCNVDINARSDLNIIPFRLVPACFRALSDQSWDAVYQLMARFRPSRSGVDQVWASFGRISPRFGRRSGVSTHVEPRPRNSGGSDHTLLLVRSWSSLAGIGTIGRIRWVLGRSWLTLGHGRSDSGLSDRTVGRVWPKLKRPR